MTALLIRYWRLIALVAGIIVVFWLMYLMRSFLLPFGIGVVLAYLLIPVVDWLQKRLPPRSKWPHFRRFLAVIIVFILLICLVGGFLYLLVSTIINASITLINDTPTFLSDAFNRVQQWSEGLISSLPPDIQQQVRDAFGSGGMTIGNAIRNLFTGTFTAIPAAFDVILGFAVLPFFLFYLLLDHEKLNKYLSSVLPSGVVLHGRGIVNCVERVMGRYIKSQLFLGLVVGTVSYLGLLALGVPYAVALALMAGVGEVIPTLGPWIAGALAVIVTLAVAPEKTLWVALLYFGIQIVENTILVPRIQSSFLGIHPALMIVLLVFGAYIAGIWGILLIGPITATLVEIYKYIAGCDICRLTLNIPDSPT